MDKSPEEYRGFNISYNPKSGPPTNDWDYSKCDWDLGDEIGTGSTRASCKAQIDEYWAEAQANSR